MAETAYGRAKVASVVVRPVRYEERARWRQLMNAHHYLGFWPIVGESLWYVASSAEQWVALLGWGAAALKCGARDAWIGWTPSLKFPRLHLIANSVRFLILPWVRIRYLASHLLAQAARQLARDWRAAYQVPPLLLETLVDAARFPGTCYRAANWIEVGLTQGRGRMDRTGQAQDRSPKHIFLYPLHPQARQLLCRQPSSRSCS